MMRWPACRRPRIGPILKPEVLLWQCRLDGGAYKCTIAVLLFAGTPIDLPSILVTGKGQQFCSLAY